jgi:hypothetical protein
MNVFQIHLLVSRDFPLFITVKLKIKYRYPYCKHKRPPGTDGLTIVWNKPSKIQPDWHLKFYQEKWTAAEMSFDWPKSRHMTTSCGSLKSGEMITLSVLITSSQALCWIFFKSDWNLTCAIDQRTDAMPFSPHLHSNTIHVYHWSLVYHALSNDKSSTYQISNVL